MFPPDIPMTSAQRLHQFEEVRQFAIKRAEPKLRVKAGWFADPARNRHEQDYLKYAAKMFPSSVSNGAVINPNGAASNSPGQVCKVDGSLAQNLL